MEGEVVWVKVGKQWQVGMVISPKDPEFADLVATFINKGGLKLSKSYKLVFCFLNKKL